MIARLAGFGTLGLAIGFAFALGTAARAADSLSFDDPGMHFTAPAGWTRVDQGPAYGGPSDAQADAPAAVFVYHQSQNDQRTIIIEIQPFDGTLDGFEGHHESELHSNNQDATFVDKRSKTTLANGMPAYFLRISSGSDAGHFMRRYEYLVYDGKRTIVVTYAGRQGDFDDKDAQAAMSSLYVVAYPRAHP